MPRVSENPRLKKHGAGTQVGEGFGDGAGTLYRVKVIQDPPCYPGADALDVLLALELNF